MTTILRDSTNPSNIPLDTPIVGGYVDGFYGPEMVYGYGWNQAAWDKFPKAKKRRIAAVTVDTPSNTADSERFDLTPAQVPIWAKNMLAIGETDLWTYCSRAPQHAIEDDLWNAGIPLNKMSMWIATLDNTLIVPRYRYPIAAVQYIDVGPYDQSIVYAVNGGSMANLVTGDSGNADPHGKGAVYVTDWLWKRYIFDPGALPGYEASLGPVQTVAQGALNEVPEVVPTAATNYPTKIEGTLS